MRGGAPHGAGPSWGRRSRSCPQSRRWTRCCWSSQACPAVGRHMSHRRVGTYGLGQGKGFASHTAGCSAWWLQAVHHRPHCASSSEYDACAAREPHSVRIMMAPVGLRCMDMRPCMAMTLTRGAANMQNAHKQEQQPRPLKSHLHVHCGRCATCPTVYEHSRTHYHTVTEGRGEGVTPGRWEFCSSCCCSGPQYASSACTH